LFGDQLDLPIGTDSSCVGIELAAVGKLLLSDRQDIDRPTGSASTSKVP